MTHKQEVLEELAEYNRKKTFAEAKFCKPPKRIMSHKPYHAGENSEKLPSELRGTHCDSYWQVCAALGCRRYANYMRDQTRLEKFTKKQRRKRK